MERLGHVVDAGVVPRAVDPTLLFHDPRDGGRDGIFVGDVERDERRAGPALLRDLDGLVAAGDVDVEDVHMRRAFTGEHAGTFATHAARGTGDHRDLAVDETHLRPHLFQWSENCTNSSSTGMTSSRGAEGTRSTTSVQPAAA